MPFFSLLPLLVGLFLITLPATGHSLTLETLVQHLQEETPPPTTTLGRDDRTCMAQALYHEARGETLKGQIAVASVILNRAAADRWSDSVCGVIGWPSQFSFVRGNRVPPVHEHEAWARAWALSGLITTPPAMFEGVDHFHTTAVSPPWRHKMERRIQVGAHIFYQDPDTTFPEIDS